MLSSIWKMKIDGSHAFVVFVIAKLLGSYRKETPETPVMHMPAMAGVWTDEADLQKC